MNKYKQYSAVCNILSMFYPLLFVSGASKHDKRRSSVPTTTVTRLDPIADEPGSPSGGAMGVGGSSGGSTSPGYKLSASVRSKREKFESSDEVLAPPPPVNRPPRSTRNQVGPRMSTEFDPKWTIVRFRKS